MLLSEVVATSAAVSSTAGRSAKVAALADLVRRLEPEEVGVVVAALTGEVRQGRIGVGWATVAGLDVPAAPEPTLTVVALDQALDELAATVGTGSQALRTTRLRALMAAATEDEQAFLGRLLLGELRQGALEGVVADGVAKAAGVPMAFSADISAMVAVLLVVISIVSGILALGILKKSQPADLLR